MTPPDSSDWYDNHVRDAAERYEAFAFPDVHRALLALLPSPAAPAPASTYKLALLRTLCRIADGAAGMSRDAGESHVSVPLGLVALTWVRLFHPLIRGDFPQAPLLPDGRGLSFVRDGFRELLKLSAGDLRIGMRFSGEQACALHAALKDARDTIVSQPVRYMKIPNGDPMLHPLKHPITSRRSDLI